MKLSIIIPVYNEKETILEILKRLDNLDLDEIKKEIIIIDDCSNDGTREIIKNLIGDYKVIYHDKNQGKGFAIRNGLKEATGDYLVVQDADMEYDPKDFKAMINKMISENLKVIYGSRRLKKDNTQYSGLLYYFGGWLLTTITNLLYGQELTDEPTCYKMFKTEFLKSLPLQCNRFDFCPEVTALSAIRDIKISEVPISYYPRHKNEGKKISWRDAFIAAWVLLKFRIKSSNKLILLLVFLATVNLLVFRALYGFHPNNDTDSFIWLINFFRNPQGPFIYPNRYLNPFYAVVGSKILFFMSPEKSLITTNIFFYYSLILLTYGLVRRVFKNSFIGFVSAIVVMTGYPMLRYSLTQVQDIGGYLWFLLTIYTGWRWWENKDNAWLWLGGIAVAFGVLTKESGCMGALTVGILFLFDKVSWKEKARNFVRFSIFPFVTIVINSFRGRDVGYSSSQWFIQNWQAYAKDNYTLLKWLGVHASTYSILWPFIIVGLYFLIKKRQILDRNIKIYLSAVIPSSLSYYMWPLFIGRTVFISAWLFVPIASYGIYSIYIKGSWFRYIAIAMVVLSIVVPYVLQSTLHYANIFAIMKVCKNSVTCSWSYFWHNRQGFSVTGDRNYFDYN